jgi:hypothetical protein
MLLNSEGCVACGRDLHDECPVDPCCCSVDTSTTVVSGTSIMGRPLKSDEDLSTSGGRKRAAAEYKMYEEKPCEWRWQANCGGGKFPIIGCLNGKQKNRHHGPIKNTAHNEVKNVHLICEHCHNTWHAINDPVYVEEEFAQLPHIPRPMTTDEMAKASDL